MLIKTAAHKLDESEMENIKDMVGNARRMGTLVDDSLCAGISLTRA